jgi:hypothetical protein
VPRPRIEVRSRSRSRRRRSACSFIFRFPRRPRCAIGSHYDGRGHSHSLRWPWPFPLTTMAVAIPTHYDGRGHSHTDCRPSGVKSQIETVSDYQIVIGDFVGMAELMSCFGSAVVVEFGGLFHGGWRGSPRCAGFIRSAHSVQTTYT